MRTCESAVRACEPAGSYRPGMAKKSLKRATKARNVKAPKRATKAGSATKSRAERIRATLPAQPLLAGPEVDRLLGISRRTRLRWRDRGSLREVRPGGGAPRYLTEDIFELLLAAEAEV